MIRRTIELDTQAVDILVEEFLEKHGVPESAKILSKTWTLTEEPIYHRNEQVGTEMRASCVVAYYDQGN